MAAVPARADMAFSAAPSGPADPDHGTGQWNLGMQFTADVALSVDALGIYDNSVSTPQEVAIFDSGGNIVAQTVVTPQTDVLNGMYWWHGISPIVLQAGQTYIVDEYVDNDWWGFDIGPTLPVVSPLITFNQSLYNTVAGISVPNTHYGLQSSYYGPNLTISGVAPDGGASVTLLTFGLLGLGFVRGQSKRRA